MTSRTIKANTDRTGDTAQRCMAYCCCKDDDNYWLSVDNLDAPEYIAIGGVYASRLESDALYVKTTIRENLNAG